MTHNNNRLGPGRNYGGTADFTFCRKVFFLVKKHPKFVKRLIFIWEKGTFLFAKLFLVVARTELESNIAKGTMDPGVDCFDQ